MIMYRIKFLGQSALIIAIEAELIWRTASVKVRIRVGLVSGQDRVKAGL